MKPIRLLVAALEEVHEATLYYEHCSSGLGRDLGFCLESALREIQKNPERWPVVKSGNVHRLVLSRFPFCLFYRIDLHEIVVLAVMHTSRNPVHWKGRVG